MSRIFRGGAFLCLLITLIIAIDLVAPGVESAQIDVVHVEIKKMGKGGPQGLVRNSSQSKMRYTPTSIALAANKGDSISVLRSRIIHFEKRHTLRRQGEEIRSALTVFCYYYLAAAVLIGLLPASICLRPVRWKPGLISGFWMAVSQFAALIVVAKAVSVTFGVGESKVDGFVYWLVQGIFALALGGAFFLLIVAILSAWDIVVRRIR